MPPKKPMKNPSFVKPRITDGIVRTRRKPQPKECEDSSERVQASIGECLADVVANNVFRVKRSDER
jgi:hypothetical protein